jgi:Ice-binding-like/Carboxypeptidase regulatory-like domain
MKTLKKMQSTGLLPTLLLVVMMAVPAPAMAVPPPVPLGTASTFAVLAGSTVTNTGSTAIDGDVGVSPGTAITGFPPGIVSGGIMHSADASAALAQSSLTIAYNDAAHRPTTQDLTGQDLGGLTLTPGVYSFSSSAQLTGVLTLDAQGDPNAVFIFKIGTTLTTASNSSVNLLNGAGYFRTFWQVGSSATLGTGTHFVGHILAMDSITANTGATVQGHLLARTGAVTLDTNVLDVTDRGSIAGTITVGVAPVSGAFVRAFTLPSGTLAGGVFTNGSGGYTLSGLPDGDYVVRFTNTGGYDQYYDHQLPMSAATHVHVAAAGTTTVSSDLAPLPPPTPTTGSIAGTITVGVAPVSGAFVRAFTLPSGTLAGGVFTNGSGGYTLSGLPDGDYVVRFTNTGGYDQYYDHQLPMSAATHVHVAAAGTTTVSSDLAPLPPPVTQSIEGTITYYGVAQKQVIVCAFDATTHAYVKGMLTDGDGFYRITDLAIGDYYVRITGTTPPDLAMFFDHHEMSLDFMDQADVVRITSPGQTVTVSTDLAP